MESMLVPSALLPSAVPYALCWESWPEPLQGFGDRKRTDAPHTSRVHWRAWDSTALMMLGGRRSRPSSMLAYLWVIPDPAASADVGRGEKGAVQAVQSAGPGWGFISRPLAEQGVPVCCWQRGAGVAGDTVCFSVSGSNLLSRV